MADEIKVTIAAQIAILVLGFDRQYFDSAEAWTHGVEALNENEEWLTHFGKSHENRQIVRMSTYAIEP